MNRLSLFSTAALLLVIQATSQAGFLAPFSGHTVFGLDDGVSNSDASRADGTVSFSVYETVDADWTNDFTAGFDGAVSDLSTLGTDSDTTLVFFYQGVNSDPKPGLPEDALDSLQIRFNTEIMPTSWGYVSDYVFTEAAGSVGTGGNEELGTSGLSTGDVIDGVPTQSGVVPTGFASLAAAVDPSSASMAAGVLQWNFLSGNILAGGTSSVLFLTVDTPYVAYDKGVLTDFGETNGDVAIPTVPEPTSLALLGMGAFGLFGFGLRRKK